MEKRESKRPSHFPSALAGAALSAAVPFFTGCGASDSELPPPMEMGADSSKNVVAAVSSKCEPGAVQHCKVIRGEFQGIQSCFDGGQMCFDGEWGPCGDPADVLPPGVVMPPLPAEK